jgi:spore coat polysaccharide biosynthesis protein SpsF
VDQINIEFLGEGYTVIVAVLQARVSSTRLPGKVLKPILGIPMILRQIERIRRVQGIDQVLLATSVDRSDDPLAALCQDNGVVCFRGSLDDVLDRYYQAVKPLMPDHVVRLTGDCPLCDPSLIDLVIGFHINGQFDYTSDALEPTYPDGLDVEVIRFECLSQAWLEARIHSHREHVTPYIYRQPGRFRIGSFRGDVDLSELRWTVDEPDDFILATRIYEALYSTNPEFGTAEILNLLDCCPELKSINVHYQRNEGYQKSLSKDKLFSSL